MNNYYVIQEKYPNYIVIEKKKIYYTARGKSAVALSAISSLNLQYDISGNVSVTTVKPETITSKLKENNFSYLVFNKDKVIESFHRNNPYIFVPLHETDEDMSFKSIITAIDTLENNSENLSKNQGISYSVLKKILYLAKIGLITIFNDKIDYYSKKKFSKQIEKYKIKDNSTETKTPASSSVATDEDREDKEDSIFTPRNCFWYKKGDCNGMRCDYGKCGDFRPAIHISEEEKDSWPKYGDATAFRLNDRERFKEKNI